MDVLDKFVYTSPEVTPAFSVTSFPYMEGTKLGKGGIQEVATIN